MEDDPSAGAHATYRRNLGGAPAAGCPALAIVVVCNMNQRTYNFSLSLPLTLSMCVCVHSVTRPFKGVK